MTARLNYEFAQGEFARATGDWQSKMATAATAAVKAAGQIAEAQGRRDRAAAAGKFGLRWQTGWRADIAYPKSGVFINACRSSWARFRDRPPQANAKTCFVIIAGQSTLRRHQAITSCGVSRCTGGEESVAIMATFDEVRRQIGLKYPTE